MFNIFIAKIKKLKPSLTIFENIKTRSIKQRHWIINDNFKMTQKFIVECWNKNWIIDNVEIINKLI